MDMKLISLLLVISLMVVSCGMTTTAFSPTATIQPSAKSATATPAPIRKIPAAPNGQVWLYLPSVAGLVLVNKNMLQPGLVIKMLATGSIYLVTQAGETIALILYRFVGGVLAPVATVIYAIPGGLQEMMEGPRTITMYGIRSDYYIDGSVIFTVLDPQAAQRALDDGKVIEQVTVKVQVQVTVQAQVRPTPDNNLRIAIVDDSTTTSDSIKNILLRQWGGAKIETWFSCEMLIVALQADPQRNYAAYIVDFNLGSRKLNGAECTAQILALRPGGIIIGASTDEDFAIKEAFSEAGAKGFAAKGGSIASFLKVIQGALQ